MRLFLLQPEANNAAACINQWQKLCQADDACIVMGYAVLHFQIPHVQLCKQIYCLTTEAALLANDLKAQVQIIDYAELAALMVQTTQAITLK